MTEIGLTTAVMAGDRTLELRLFCLEELTEASEGRLTRELCSLMTRYKSAWIRYYLVPCLGITLVFFRLSGLYTGDWSSLDGCMALQRILGQYSLELYVIDCMVPRYFDVYCVITG